MARRRKRTPVASTIPAASCRQRLRVPIAAAAAQEATASTVPRCRDTAGEGAACTITPPAPPPRESPRASAPSTSSPPVSAPTPQKTDVLPSHAPPPHIPTPSSCAPPRTHTSPTHTPTHHSTNPQTRPAPAPSPPPPTPTPLLNNIPAGCLADTGNPQAAGCRRGTRAAPRHRQGGPTGRAVRPRAGRRRPWTPATGPRRL